MLIKVKAFPAAKEEKIIKKSETNFEIYIREKPVKGLANERIRAVLAAFLKLPENKVRLVKGYRQRNKIFSLDESQ